MHDLVSLGIEVRMHNSPRVDQPAALLVLPGVQVCQQCHNLRSTGDMIGERCRWCDE